MADIIHTATLRPNSQPSALDTLQTYNGLDCCITLEVLEELESLGIPPEAQLIYDFERALQAPAMEMMLRGFRIDSISRDEGIKFLQGRLEKLNNILQRYAFACWNKTLNPRSHKQMKAFFYDAMGIPEIWTSFKGVRKLSFNREILEKLDAYFQVRPIIATILAFRDTAKKLEVFQTAIDSDGRMRTSINLAGTETGRWSSSKSVEGTGGNLQNITAELRYPFIADKGKKLCVIDLEQAESRIVGWLCGTLFNDWSYLDACESGDLHTLTARLIWPQLGWTGQAKEDRAIAEQIFYRNFTYRDMSKRGGHGSNYFGKPFTMARHLKVQQELMEHFQRAYFKAFPSIPRWHAHVAKEIQTKHSLVTPLGRRRHFFGRPRDDATLREAIAFVPQSSIADIMNLGLWRLWSSPLPIELLGQVHDAVIFQYPDDPKIEASIIPQTLKLIEIPLSHPSTPRTLIIPGEAKVGWNWGYVHDKKKPTGPGNRYNPDGLDKWRGGDSRKRTNGLDRVLS